MLYSSVKTNADITRNILALPTQLYLQNYIDAWKRADLGILFVNSVLYTASSTVLVLALSLMMGYAFAKMRYQAVSKVLYTVVGLGLLISVQAILIPLFIMLMRYGLKDTRVGVIIVYTAIGLPIAVYLATEYIKGIPNSMIESAYMDGASHFLMFRAIVVPMATPVALTIGIMNILSTWNEFLLVFILTSSRTARSLPVGVYSFSSLTSQQYGMQLAAMVIAVTPVVLAYVFFNRRITEGVVAGAIKG
jgi:raffinose/stachyose/melibiose transport system permease protein